jgi:sortase (surface protein transpeptidase)
MVGLSLVGVAALAFSRLGADRPPPVRVSGTLFAATSPSPRFPPAPRLELPSRALQAAPGARAPRGAPAMLTIPAIDVRTRLVRLGLNPDGSLEVPADFSVAGWYELGPRPGEQGAAVVVGHVDSKQGPAVFYRLGGLAPGALVSVGWANGSEVSFHVYAVREYAKAAFPASLVYGKTPAPELRLVTCGGPFDRQTGHYVDNLVVFAR